MLFNGASDVNGHDSARHVVGMNEHQVAPFLPILDKPACLSARIDSRAVSDGSFLGMLYAGTEAGTLTLP